MKASIIIPAYNEEKLIAMAIRAALNQNYHDFEVIVVNNASKDNTEQIAKQYPVKIVTETKKGLQRAREKGRLEAQGDIIVNMDADCCPEPHWLSKGMAHFADPTVVAATGPYDHYDGSKFFQKSTLFIQQYIYLSVHRLFVLCHWGAILMGGNCFIRATTLHKIGGYNIDIDFYGDDVDTAKRTSRQGKIIYDPNLIIKSSARRYKAEGTIACSSRYIFHFFRTIFSPK